MDTTKPAWKIREEQRYLDKFDADVILHDGVPYWKSNGRVPPKDIVAVWVENGKPIDVAAANESRDAQTRRAIEEYRKAQQNRTPEQISEERLEALAAFGPGETVVNVITGERYRT